MWIGKNKIKNWKDMKNSNEKDTKIKLSGALNK